MKHASLPLAGGNNPKFQCVWYIWIIPAGTVLHVGLHINGDIEWTRAEPAPKGHHSLNTLIPFDRGSNASRRFALLNELGTLIEYTASIQGLQAKEAVVGRAAVTLDQGWQKQII